MTSTIATPEQLTYVRVVCQCGPDALRLPRVAEALNNFLDGSVGWTLVQACCANLLNLVRRKLGEVDPFADVVAPYTTRGYRQWQFTQGLITPVAKGNLELVRLLSQHFDECYIGKSVLFEAIKFDRLEILQWLVFHRSSIAWTWNQMGDAVRMGHLELAKWLFGLDGAWHSTWSKPVWLMKHWSTLAAANGDLPMLEWICSLSTDVNLSDAFGKAISTCRLDVVKWLPKIDVPKLPNAEPGGEDADNPRLINLDRPAALGDFDTVEWLIRCNVDDCYVNGGDLEAARLGHFEIVAYSEQATSRAAPTGSCDLQQKVGMSSSSSGCTTMGSVLSQELATTPPTLRLQTDFSTL